MNENNNLGLICRDVVLEKNGVRYSGILVGSQETINNGQWALQAAPNAMAIENMISNVSDIYLSKNFNLLMINGPGVGNSQGTATPTTMGDAQEVGISFLETAIKANKIVIAGYSLGGAAIGQAISQHEFKTEGVEYHVVRQMTFDRASNVCGRIVGQFVPFLEGVVSKIIKFSGCEMDSIAASKKLSNNNIDEIIVQATDANVSTVSTTPPSSDDFMTDGIITPEASLGYTLVKETTTNKKFISLLEAPHMTWNAITLPIEVISRSASRNKE